MNKQGICYVFGAAPIDDYKYITINKRINDIVICADGGMTHLDYLKIKADIILGDFDSGKRPENEFFIEYPSKKDETDMLLAVRAGLSRGYKKFKIFGGLGGRFDHTFANVQLLVYLEMHDAKGILYDKTNEIHFICGSGNIILNRKQGYMISLLSMTDTCEGITTKGLEYPLENSTLTNDFPLGISNVFVDNQAEISMKSGKLLVILSKD